MKIRACNGARRCSRIVQLLHLYGQVDIGKLDEHIAFHRNVIRS